MTATDHEVLFLRPAEAAKLAGLSSRAIYRASRDAFDEWVAPRHGARRAPDR